MNHHDTQHLRGFINDRVRAARNLLAEMGTHPAPGKAAAFDALLDEAETAELLLANRPSARSGDPLFAWAEQRVALDAFLRRGDAGIRNTMGTGTGSQGGYTVGTMVAREIVDVLKGYGWMRQVASQFSTSSGGAMSIPLSLDASVSGERLAENATASATDPSFGTSPINTTKYGSKIITVPIELLQDSAVDLVSWVQAKAIDRIGRIQNLDFTVGTGTGQPTGLVTAAGVGKTGATGQTITVLYDDLVDLADSVDAGWLGQPSSQPGLPSAATAGWMFSQATRKVVRKLKDSNGRPIWVPGDDDSPAMLLDAPVFINNDMPSPGASAKSIAFGNFGAYRIRDVVEVAFYRFESSAYVVNGQVGFLMLHRSGGTLTDTAAVKVYQHSAT